MSLCKKGLLIIVCIFIAGSCFNNADRDNPLDPNSDDYQAFGELQGFVYTYYAPFQPIAGAKITLLPGFQITSTGASGQFSLKNITPGDYFITVTFEGYAPDTASVQIEPNKIASLQFNLDGLPRLESLSLTSGTEHNYYLADPNQYLSCTAAVSDPDGLADITSVVMAIPQFGFKDTLSISQLVGAYQVMYQESDLPFQNIEELLGEEVYMELSDKAGKSQRFGPYFLARIISEQPVAVAPVANAQVTGNPAFQWQELKPPFPFTFKIEIYLIIASQVVFPPRKTISNLSSETFAYQLNELLDAGQYLWIISIVDKWGNWSRSTPATFQVIK